MKDSYGRIIDYMRVSITDRCNLRCRYCMPENLLLNPREELLSYEELLLVCRAAAQEGIRKLKVTGGEPLVRTDCVRLIGKLKQIPGIDQVTLTTNGVELTKYLPELIAAGVDGINISLDTLDRDRYRTITGRDELERVRDSVDAAVRSGIPVKINCVPQGDTDEEEWLELAELAKERPIDVRFIEMMPIGYGRDFSAISNVQIRESLRRRYPELHEDARIHGNGPAQYVRIEGWKGSIGFISAIHEKFCSTCNRIRLTSAGELKPCLCYSCGVDLREILRSGSPVREKAVDSIPAVDAMQAEGPDIDAQLRAAIRQAIRMKPEQHCFDQLIAWKGRKPEQTGPAGKPKEQCQSDGGDFAETSLRAAKIEKKQLEDREMIRIGG